MKSVSERGKNVCASIATALKLMRWRRVSLVKLLLGNCWVKNFNFDLILFHCCKIAFSARFGWKGYIEQIQGKESERGAKWETTRTSLFFWFIFHSVYVASMMEFRLLFSHLTRRELVTLTLDCAMQYTSRKKEKNPLKSRNPFKLVYRIHRACIMLRGICGAAINLKFIISRKKTTLTVGEKSPCESVVNCICLAAA